jgi:uncharacterized protein YjdB
MFRFEHNITNTTSGGTWSSANGSVATIDANTGIVTTVSTGTTLITYTIAATGGCNASTATTTVTVTEQQTASAIGGTTAVCLGSNTHLLIQQVVEHGAVLTDQ